MLRSSESPAPSSSQGCEQQNPTQSGQGCSDPVDPQLPQHPKAQAAHPRTKSGLGCSGPQLIPKPEQQIPAHPSTKPGLGCSDPVDPQLPAHPRKSQHKVRSRMLRSSQSPAHPKAVSSTSQQIPAQSQV